LVFYDGVFVGSLFVHWFISSMVRWSFMMDAFAVSLFVQWFIGSLVFYDGCIAV